MLAKNALTTLERAKKHLGIPTPIPTVGVAKEYISDEDLYFLINSASSLIERYCNRKFGLTIHTDFLQGRDTTRLVLDHYPIIELHTLSVLDEDIDITKVRVLSEKGMLYRANGGFPSVVNGGRFMHPKPDIGYDTISVEYSAGYVLPKDETVDVPRTLPFDLELACLKMISHMNRDREIQQGNGDSNLIMKSESIGDWSASYDQAVKTDADSSTRYLSSDVLSVLCEYKRSEFEI